MVLVLNLAHVFGLRHEAVLCLQHGYMDAGEMVPRECARRVHDGPVHAA